MTTEELKNLAIQKGYGTAKCHILLCVNDKCAPNDVALKLWEFLKKRLNEIEPDSRQATILRSKVGCLRICANGPVALVYPEGTLYYELDEQKLEKIIQEHLIQGKPIKEYSFFENILKN